MKTFTNEMEIKLNVLAIRGQSGNIEAQHEFIEMMFPYLQGYSKKFRNSFIDSGDLSNEFVISAYKAMNSFKVEKNQNVSGLVFATCKNDFLKLKEKHDAEKRSKFRDSMVHLDKEVGDGGITLNEVVTSEEKSIQLLVEEQEQKDAVSAMISEFSQVSKGRHAKIVEAVYMGHIQGWDSEEQELAIYNILIAEKGKAPTREAIRKAKSRALKTIREALESGEVGLSSQV